MTFEEAYEGSRELRDRFSSLMSEMVKKPAGERMDPSDPLTIELNSLLVELKEKEQQFFDEFFEQTVLKTYYPVSIFFTRYFEFLRNADNTDAKKFDEDMVTLMLLFAETQREFLQMEKTLFLPFSMRHGVNKDDMVEKLKNLGVEPSVKYDSAFEEIFSKNIPEGSSLDPEGIKEVVTLQMSKFNEILDLIATPGFDAENSNESKAALVKLYDELAAIEETNVTQILNAMLYQAFFPVKLFEEKVFSENLARLRETAGPLKDRFTVMMDELKHATEKYMTMRDYFIKSFCGRHDLDLNAVLEEVFEKIDTYKNFRVSNTDLISGRQYT